MGYQDQAVTSQYGMNAFQNASRAMDEDVLGTHVKREALQNGDLPTNGCAAVIFDLTVQQQRMHFRNRL